MLANRVKVTTGIIFTTKISLILRYGTTGRSERDSEKVCKMAVNCSDINYVKTNAIDLQKK